MQIKYSNKTDKYLKDEQSINRKYGKFSKNIMVCLSILVVADNLEMVPNEPPLRRHKLSNGNWAIDISKNWRMVIRPIDGTEPREIKTVEIVDIEDYH